MHFSLEIAEIPFDNIKHCLNLQRLKCLIMLLASLASVCTVSLQHILEIAEIPFDNINIVLTSNI